MGTITSRDQFKPIRIRRNLVVNYNGWQHIAKCFLLICAYIARIYILFSFTNAKGELTILRVTQHENFDNLNWYRSPQAWNYGVTSFIIKIKITVSSIVMLGLKNLLFSTNLPGQFVIRQFVTGQFVIGQFVIGQIIIRQFNRPITFKVAV